MATNLIRNLPKSYRQSPLGVKIQQTRNASSTGPLPPQVPPIQAQQMRPPAPLQPPVRNDSLSGSLKAAVGLSIGLSVGLGLSQVNRLLPNPEPPKKQETIVPTIDPKMVEHIISQDRKVNQLENQLSSLREELLERERQSFNQPKPAQQGCGNVFELSEVIQANNMALDARHSRDLEEQRKSMVREQMLKIEGEILKVENKYRPVINKIRELEAHLENQRQLQQIEAPARLLWLSCQSLMERLRDSPQQPLERDPAYDVLKKFAAKDNPLAVSVLDSIPPKVLKEGVQSEETLAERFQRLERICKRVALVDSHGAGLGQYILSYLQSLFIIDRSHSISDDEIGGKKMVDPTSWTTFDILARVRYCLARGNLEQAVRYANQLKGQARVVARDWIHDARLHLLTRQALSALSTHAKTFI